MKLFSLLLFAAAAFAQVVPPPPAPPACLSGPVTQGNVTITCSMIDYTQPNHGSDQAVLFSAASGYIFQVRASSSDPNVIGVRIAVTAGPTGGQFTGWGVTGASASWGASPTDPASAPPPLVFRYTFYLGSTAITSVKVDELKSSSSQTF